MRATHVQIRNYRGLKEASVELAKFHVFVGANGSGKTSVLEALRMATSTSFSYSSLSEQDFHSADAGPIAVSVTFDVPFVAKIEDGFADQLVLCEGVDLLIKRRDAASPGKALSDPFVVSQVCRPIVYARLEEVAERPLPEGVTLERLPFAVKKVQEGHVLVRRNSSEKKIRTGAIHLGLDLIGYPIVFYFDRKREKETRQGFNSLLTRITKDLNWRYRRGWQPTEAAERWLAYYEHTVGVVAGKKRHQLLDKIRPRLAALLDGDFSDLELSLLSVEEPFSSAFISRRSGTNQIDVDGFGTGITAVLTYCLLEHVSRLAKQEIVFLIDEPELHLHIQVQRRLCREFRQAKHQIIASSHSPGFISFDSWRGITRVESGGHCFPSTAALSCTLEQRKIAEHLDDIGRYHQQRTIFSDSDADLLFTTKVILVEGPAEKYGLARLAALLGVDLTRATIISCNGKSKIPHYAILCHAYGIVPFVIFDADGRSALHSENRDITDRIGGARRYSFTRSFEQELGVGQNHPHKASTVLTRIDDIRVDEVTPEIRELVVSLGRWMDATPAASERVLYPMTSNDVR